MIKAIQRRSKRIQWLRYGLYVLSGGLVLVTLAPSLHSRDIGIAPFAIFNTESNASPTASYPVRILNPRFVGVDENEQPYEIKASLAGQPNLEKDAPLELEGLQATTTKQDGEAVAVESARATFDNETSSVVIQDAVTLQTTDGYDLSLPSGVKIDTKTGMGIGGAVSGSSPLGPVKADGITVENNGEKIRFEGDTTVVLPVGALPK